MKIAVICAGLLGLLVFGLGLIVSMVRGNSRINFGYTPDPTNRLYKLVRAHGNAAEYAPMLAVLILYLGTRNPGTWLLWTFVAATVFRYLHALGMVLGRTLDAPDPLRFVGALGTYVTGLVLAVVAVMS